ncbi:Pentatricopeptide repeat-containing protein At2g31400, partial [Durusdinium trenchii]
MLRRAQWQEALQVLGQMSEDQIRPNVVSYNCASSACAKKSRWQQSWQLLREMETKKVWPDAKSFGACASAAEKSHRWTLALQLLREQERLQVRLGQHVASAVISSCGHAGRWQHSVFVFHQLQRTGVTPNRHVLCSVVTALGAAKRWRAALATLAAELGEDVHALFSAAVAASPGAAPSPGSGFSTGRSRASGHLLPSWHGLGLPVAVGPGDLPPAACSAADEARHADHERCHGLCGSWTGLESGPSHPEGHEEAGLHEAQCGQLQRCCLSSSRGQPMAGGLSHAASHARSSSSARHCHLQYLDPCIRTCRRMAPMPPIAELQHGTGSPEHGRKCLRQVHRMAAILSPAAGRRANRGERQRLHERLLARLQVGDGVA